MRTQIFISHASQNTPLVEALVDVLEHAFEIPSTSIRCTSVPGHRASSGTVTPKQLHADLGAADLVIGVISPESLRSNWVLFELGAAWGMGKWIIPALTRGVSYPELPGPLREYNAPQLFSHADIAQIIDDVASQLSLVRKPQNESIRQIEELLRRSQ